MPTAGPSSGKWSHRSGGMHASRGLLERRGEQTGSHSRRPLEAWVDPPKEETRSLPLLSHSVLSDSQRPHGLQHAWLPCPHCLPEFAQTHVHRVGDAIQPSRPLSAASPDFSLYQHQGLFQGVGSSHQVSKVLELQGQYQSSQWSML